MQLLTHLLILFCLVNQFTHAVSFIWLIWWQISNTFLLSLNFLILAVYFFNFSLNRDSLPTSLIDLTFKLLNLLLQLDNIYFKWTYFLIFILQFFFVVAKFLNFLFACFHCLSYSIFLSMKLELQFFNLALEIIILFFEFSDCYF